MKEKKTEEEKYCPKCWRRIPADVTYCPSCGMMAEKTKPSEKKKTKLLTMGALLATIAGVVCFIAGISSCMMVMASLSFYLESHDPLYNTAFQMFTIVMISNILGFILGGTAALNAWKKTGFRSTLLATALLPIIGLLNFIVLDNSLGFDVWASMFGVAILVPSLPSLVIVATTKQEFT